MNNEQIENCLQKLLGLMVEQEDFMKELAIEITDIRNEFLKHKLNSEPTTKENESVKKIALSILDEMAETTKKALKSINIKEVNK